MPDLLREDSAFPHEFDADSGPFLRGPAGFLLALIPVGARPDLPDGFHVGFAAEAAADVVADVVTCHERLSVAGVRTSAVEDHRPGLRSVTFRCWDPDGTEVEVHWDGA